MNFNGKGTGSLSWYTLSIMREIPPIGWVPREEGGTPSLTVRGCGLPSEVDIGLSEGRYAGQGLAQDQGVHLVRTLVSPNAL